MKINDFLLPLVILCTSSTYLFSAQKLNKNLKNADHQVANSPNSIEHLTRLGLTENVIIDIRSSSASNKLKFKNGIFKLEQKPQLLGIRNISKNTKYFSCFVNNFWSTTKASEEDESLCIFKIDKEPMISLDNGKNWISGEKKDGAWIFSDSNTQFKFRSTSPKFEPKNHLTFAFSGATTFTVRLKTRSALYNRGFGPQIFDGVLAVAEGENDAQAYFKPAVHNWSLAMRGIKYGEKWIFTSSEKQPFAANYVFWEDKGIPGLNWSTTNQLYFVVDKNNIYIFSPIDKMDMDDLNGNIESMADVGLVIKITETQSFPKLLESFKTNWNRASWFSSGDNNSFSEASDREFSEKKLIFHLPTKTKYPTDNVSHLERAMNRARNLGIQVEAVQFDESGHFINQK